MSQHTVALHFVTWSVLIVVWVVVYKCEVPLLEPHLADGEGGRGREARGGAPRGGQLALLQLADQLLIKGFLSRHSFCQDDKESTWGVGPPSPHVERFLWKNSRAVDKSHIWMAPLLWPVKMNRRGLEPILVLPSHSWTQKLVMIELSTDLKIFKLER